MRKLSRSKKGLSTVISTILMIMITMIGMSLVFAYVAVYTQTYQSGVGSSVLEALTIEDVCFNGTNHVYGDDATVSIYNSGQIPATINDIFVDGKATTLTAINGEATASTGGSNSFEFNIYVPVGAQVIVTVQGPYSIWYSLTQYTFKVTTLRGSTFTEVEQAP